MSSAQFNQSGSKYLREMRHLIDGKADVYAVLLTFDVTCPARQHAIKKLLCSGIRGKGDVVQDLKEARDAIDRAIQIANGTPPVLASFALETQEFQLEASVKRDIRRCNAGKAGPFDRDDLVEVISDHRGRLGVCSYRQHQPREVRVFDVPADRFVPATDAEIAEFNSGK